MPAYKSGDFIWEEIGSQGDAWEELIPLILNHANAIREIFAGVEEVIFTGCGSALNASLSGAHIFQTMTHIPARAVPAAEIYLFPDSVLDRQRKTLGVLLSRSGKTTETVNAMEYLHDQEARTLGVTCTAESPLASHSDLALLLEAAGERAVATTRSVTGMLLTTQLLAGIVSGNSAFIEDLKLLPEAFNTNLSGFREAGLRISQNPDLTRFAFVGNGPFFGLARESQLKVKEILRMPVDAYPLLDFRHGPQSNVNEEMLVTAFISDSARQAEIRFLRDMKVFGGAIWAICDRADEAMRSNANYVLELYADIGELARVPLYLPAVQYMVYYKALSLGVNPDKPRNLSYWVDISQ